MPHDAAIADRIRSLTADEAGLTEKPMFGGLAFLIGGNMAVGASSAGGLIVRVDPEESEALIREPGAERMVMRNRPMDGWLRVDAGAVTSDEDLARWVGRGVAYARSLPPKE